MAGNRPDPGEFFDRAQRMLRGLLGDPERDDDPWASTTRLPHESSGTPQGRELNAADAAGSVS